MEKHGKTNRSDPVDSPKKHGLKSDSDAPSSMGLFEVLGILKNLLNIFVTITNNQQPYVKLAAIELFGEFSSMFKCEGLPTEILKLLFFECVRQILSSSVGMA